MLGFLFGPSWSSDKLKVQLSLSVNRIKLMKSKKENEIIRREREIAQTLSDGKEELAKVHTENVIRLAREIKANEKISLYCELVKARLPVLDSLKTKEPLPRDLDVPVGTLVWAGKKSEVDEMPKIRGIIVAKFGEVYGAECDAPGSSHVDAAVAHDLTSLPDAMEVYDCLVRIAKEHKVSKVITKPPPPFNPDIKALEETGSRSAAPRPPQGSAPLDPDLALDDGASCVGVARPTRGSEAAQGQGHGNPSEEKEKVVGEKKETAEIGTQAGGNIVAEQAALLGALYRDGRDPKE